jgi:hypothetical protein
VALALLLQLDQILAMSYGRDMTCCCRVLLHHIPAAPGRLTCTHICGDLLNAVMLILLLLLLLLPM